MMTMEGYHLAALRGLGLPPPPPSACPAKSYAASSQSVTLRMSGAPGGRNIFTDQAFHTPSFGDEDFDLPPLTLPSEHGTSYPGGRSAGLTLSGAMQPAHLPPGDPHAAPHPKFPPQNFEVPDITVSNSLGAVTLASSMYSADHGLLTSGQAPLSTISQSQMARQLGFQSALAGHSPSNSTPSPSRESSEDSDDSLPLAQLMSLKRPATSVSPDPSLDQSLPVSAAPSSSAKKPKTPKKKKKKDPNEPQKPVSAYALFFRDTQAVIKGQNPNASFGDVSKIVASMWDSLDPENKNVYKTKTEVAKKEYLKQLAAYRASQVSQGGAMDEGSSPSDKSPSPSSDRSPTAMAPPASSPLAPPPPGNALHLQAPMSHPQGGMGGYGGHQPSVSMAQIALVPSQPANMGVSHNNSLSYQQPHPQARGEHLMDTGVTANGLCVRMGCSNSAIDSPGWDSEYCSNECVVRHCRDVFTAWVATRQGNSDGFPVK